MSKIGMSPEPIVKFVKQASGWNADCGVASLAMCLGLSYSEALVLVAKVKPTVLIKGVTWKELQRAARKHSVKFRLLCKNIDLDNEELSGLLGVGFVRGGSYVEHAVFLTHGLIFDGDTETVWEPDVYLKAHNADVLSLLVRC